MKAYGFIHTHSEYSLKDAPLKLADIVKEAKKMGATAIALTAVSYTHLTLPTKA